MKRLTPILILVLLLLGCDLPHEPGPLPTEIIETQFEPGLNILGVLRADGNAGSSFIAVNRALTTEEIYSGEIENFVPSGIEIDVHGDSSSWEWSAYQEPLDSSRFSHPTWVAEPGATYDLQIRADDLPELTAQATVPHHPQVISAVLDGDRSGLSLELAGDSLSFQLKIQVLSTAGVEERVVLPQPGAPVSLEWTFTQVHSTPLLVQIVSYDANLSTYESQPISFLPNTYHADPSTVSGGYGCFGAVAITQLLL